MTVLLSKSQTATATVTGISPIGTGTHQVEASYPGDSDYAPSVSSTTGLQAMASQTINFPNPGTQTYGLAPITLTATANSGLAVSYTVTSGPATVNGRALTITGAGSVTVKATQAGNASWLAANPVGLSFSVNRAPLLVTAKNQTVGFGTPLPALTYTVTGFVNGETAAVVTGAPTCTTTALRASALGQYPINCTMGTLSAANYAFSFTPGSLAVVASSPRVLTLRSSRQGTTPATVYGIVNPDGAATTYWFEYGTREAVAKFTKTQSVILAAGTTEAPVKTTLIGVAPRSIYYFRVVATNSAGTVTGAIAEFHSGEEQTSPNGKAASSNGPEPKTTASGGLANSSSTGSQNMSSARTGTISAQSFTVEVVSGRNLPIVTSLGAVPVSKPAAFACDGLPEGATCSYDDRTQTITLTPAANTPPGSYPIRVLFASEANPDQ